MNAAGSRRPRLPSIALAAFCLSFGTSARAQEPLRFDPARDLDGFENCFTSEFRNLYPLDTYSDLLAKEMSPAALAEVQSKWKADRAAGDARRAALRAVPAEESLWLLHDRLSRSRYFSKITWTEDRSLPGFVFLVQRPSKDVPDHAAEIAHGYAPWLEKLQSLFEERYVKPLMLERPPARTLWAIAILSSEGDYLNFWRIHPNYGPEAARACYDHKLGLAVGYEDPFKPTLSPIDQRYPILNAFARAMIAGYSNSPEGRPGSLWIEEGLASYLAYHEGIAPACLDERRIRASTLQTVVDMAMDKKRGPVFLHPIEELVALKSSEDVDKIVMRKAEAAATPPPAEADVLGTFYGQSTLWMHFLQDGSLGAGSSLRENFLKYFRWALSGDAGAGVLKLAFEGKDLAQIDRSYLRWLAEEGKRARPQANVDGAVIDALFGNAAVREAGAGKESSVAPAVFSPSVLAIEGADVESRHGLALLQARAGDLEGAVAELRALSQGTLTAEEAPRVAREISRISELRKLRDGFLENLRASGAKWSTEIQGKKLVASIGRIEDGFVHLAENRQGVEKIPLAALDPMEIARQATKKESQGNSAPWARFYAYVLAEDPKWEKLLKDPSDEARALREDARTRYPSWLRSGRAARAVGSLSTASLPKGREEGEALCARVREILADFRDVALVQRKLADLKRFARVAAETALADQEPASLLHGKWAPIPGGQIALTYEFDSPAEARDFVKQVGYMKVWRKSLKLETSQEAESAWIVQDGNFTGIGAACYRFPLAFLAPMTVRYDLQILEGTGQGKEQANFAVGLCDDRKEDNVLCVNFGGLVVQDHPRDIQIHRVEDKYTYVPATTYSLEVRHDGAQASTWVDGEKSAEAPCATRTNGDVFLWFHTTLPISIERLEIRGKVDPASVGALRASCVEEKLAEMGFP